MVCIGSTADVKSVKIQQTHIRLAIYSTRSHIYNTQYSVVYTSSELVQANFAAFPLVVSHETQPPKIFCT